MAGSRNSGEEKAILEFIGKIGYKTYFYSSYDYEKKMWGKLCFLYSPMNVQRMVTNLKEIKVVSQSQLLAKDSKTEETPIHRLLNGGAFRRPVDADKDAMVTEVQPPDEKPGRYDKSWTPSQRSITLSEYEQTQYADIHLIVDALIQKAFVADSSVVLSEESIRKATELFTAQDQTKKTVLHQAVAYYIKSEQLTSLLALFKRLSQKNQTAVVTLKDDKGHNILHLAAEQPFEFMQMLVSTLSPQDVNIALRQKSKVDNNVIASICESKTDCIVKKLECVPQCDPKLFLEVNADKENALHVACKNPKTDKAVIQHIVKRLTESKDEKQYGYVKYKNVIAVFNAEASDNRKPFHMACEFLNAETIQGVIESLSQILGELEKDLFTLQQLYHGMKEGADRRALEEHMRETAKMKGTILDILTKGYKDNLDRTPLNLMGRYGVPLSLEMLVNAVDPYQDLSDDLRSGKLLKCIGQNEQSRKVTTNDLARVSGSICILMNICDYLSNHEKSELYSIKFDDFISCLQAIHERRDFEKPHERIPAKTYKMAISTKVVITAFTGSQEYYELRKELSDHYERIKDSPDVEYFTQVRMRHLFEYLKNQYLTGKSGKKSKTAENLLKGLFPEHPFVKCLPSMELEEKKGVKQPILDHIVFSVSDVFGLPRMAAHPSVLHAQSFAPRHEAISTSSRPSLNQVPAASHTTTQSAREPDVQNAFVAALQPMYPTLGTPSTLFSATQPPALPDQVPPMSAGQPDPQLSPRLRSRGSVVTS